MVRAAAICALVALAVASAVSSVAAAGKTAAGFYYIDPKQTDLTVFLPPPPDLGSPQQRADEQALAQAISARRRADYLVAQQMSVRTVFFFAPSVGTDFTPQRFPVTAEFFRRIESDVERLVDIAKDYWERPRPSGVQKRRGSYPSGHAAFAAAAAIVLSELVPSKRDAIFTQARTFAENRILLGVHYPSDVASGWTAGTLAVYAMMRDPAFVGDFYKARAELRRAYH